MILVTANLSVTYQKKLEADFPHQHFVFCKNVEVGERFLPETEILVTYGEDLNKEHIDQAAHLKWIMVLSAGMDEMPLQEIANRKILVTNARGIHKTPMSEYVIAMLLQVYRQSKTLIKHEMQHEWNRSVPMQEISGRTMLIVGAGAIGQEVARLAKAFRMNTIGISRSGSAGVYFDETYSIDNLEQLLTRADFLISVLPSTPETRSLYTYEHFKRLPNHAIFLNMGRGDVVADEVILKAVRNQQILHAVLDVFDQEPLPPSHPFWGEERITVTPHLSGVSAKYLERALAIFTNNLQCYLAENDSYLNKIDPNRGY